MTVLVTGASGFLGGRLVQRLIVRGEPVRVLARKTSDLSHLDGLSIDVAYGDLREPESLAAAVAGVSTVFHCAALATDWSPDAAFVAANVDGTRNVLQAAIDSGTAERLVHVSTTDVFGYPSVIPPAPVPLRDVGLPYNSTKLRGERIVWELAGTSGFPVVVARPASIYGPRGEDFVCEIVRLLRSRAMLIIDGGRSHAGLQYVDNAADALIALAACPGAVGKAYDLRDDEDVTWRRYVDELAAGLGLPRPWLNLPDRVAMVAGRGCELVYGRLGIKSRPLLTRHAVNLLCRDQGYSTEAYRRDVGELSAVGFDEGMRRTIEWVNSPQGRARTGGKAQ